EDPVDRVSARPDFVILCYPVVSMSEDCTHRRSRANLTGSEPEPALLDALSLEKRITPKCPPVFLWLTLEDQTVDPENSRLLEAALKKNQVPYQAVYYRHGPHGLGLLTTEERKKYPETAKWPRQLLAFLRDRNILVSNVEDCHE
ncbi:MAG: alpha/beta hydrolase, partial [Lentisphaeria bacterium]|nr:alpha/beta hydrolase [Lentisphaeria bacterium]